MTKKLWIAAIYVLIIIVMLFNRNTIITWLDEGHSLPLLLVIILTFFMAFFQVIPYGIVTGYLGNQYGWFFGGLLSLLCTIGAAITLFFITRYVFAEKGREFLRKYKPVDSFTKMVESKPFLAVLIGRLTPILPSQVISVYSALSSMSNTPYIIATIIGKIPLAIVYALVGDQITQPVHLLQIGGIYGVFLLVVYGLYRLWSHQLEK
jgi:uncharacterized membrane protein YdjX (TVP38/TMEM64 family)